MRFPWSSSGIILKTTKKERSFIQNGQVNVYVNKLSLCSLPITFFFKHLKKKKKRGGVYTHLRFQSVPVAVQ